MSTAETTLAPHPPLVDAQPTGPVEARRGRPVLWWAGVGGFFIALQGYLFTAWIVSGDAKPTPKGPDPVPEWMKWAIHGQEVLSVLALVAFVYVLVWRPWRRQGHLSLDGLFVLAFPFAWWQEPLLNYTQHWGTYNAETINFGSWGAQIPGSIAPNGNLFIESPLWTSAAYVWAVFGAVLLANALMRRAHARWPSMSRTTMIVGTVGTFWVLDFVAEMAWLRTGVYAYPGAIAPLTIFHGHYYQFPVYEAIFFGSTWAGWALLRYFRDDHGRTFVERGIERVPTTPRRKTALRFAALVGIINLLFLGTMIPFQWFGMHADPWPADFTHRSYLRDGICGPGTDYACSGPAVPIPRRDSAHLDPQGRLVPANQEN